jgi:RNA polymerase sigma-70 factor (ECF subfamily)
MKGMTAAVTNQAHAGPEDLADLVHQHQAGIWRYLRYLGCDSALADDLVQETFLEIHRRPIEHRSSVQSVVYLRKVARNQLRMAARKSSRRPVVENLELAEEVWARHAGDDHLEDYLADLRACLESAVTERVRAALALSYHDGAKREQIAQQLEMTGDGVKTMLRRARSALRECIERKRKNDG